MRDRDQLESEEQEDHAVADRAATTRDVTGDAAAAAQRVRDSPQHLDEVLDGDVRLAGNVVECVVGLHEAATDHAGRERGHCKSRFYHL